ncbi:PREDICTED: uncharacterized protein LOC105454335 [Wasmannia auropunctata]|uniref:uncharacterized protein LOC105454335 n=1 Tax=Wasmannia auropunctata TaxID=64793 RepID=UPI0005F04F69|nr:PREDICTED: uncharacterized protein LOC105454335 [Wasmannia auropunctata]
MIVNNVITIIFVVITGTAFMGCALAAGRHRLKLRKAIGHKSNSDDVLLRALSDFSVVRRSLNPMIFKQYSSYSGIQYLIEDGENVPNVENKKNIVIQKLKFSVTFRDNILYIFSYLLHGRENDLTDEQYTPLQMLYQLLKKKMNYMYNLLPILSKLNSVDKNRQTSIILLSLMKNLPAYIQCTAKYLANEIDSGRIDLNTLLQPTAEETFDYLANIDLDTVSKGNIKNEEIRGYDKFSNITQKALGPVFVKLLSKLQTNKLPLSQELFSLILINLPNPSDDPVLEENIRYLYDLTKNNAIDSKEWSSIGKDPAAQDAYTLVFSVLTKILNSNVPMVVKDAAAYVYHHLKLVTVPTHVNTELKYMYHLLEKDIDVGMLFSAIIPYEFDADAIRMKNNLLTYFMRNYNNEDMNKILKGFNKFAFNDALDLLLAFLTRLTNRVPSFPNINTQMLQQPATALLPAVIMKRYYRTFTPFVSPEIDVLMLLESLKTPDIDQELQSTIDSIKIELIAKPQTSVLLSTLIPTEKEKCPTPKQCLINTFQQVQKLQDKIPLTLISKIQHVGYVLKSISSQQYQPRQSYATQYTIKPVDVNLYLDRDRESSIVAIETDGAYTNVPTSGFSGVPYVWNIDKYVTKIGPTGQDESHVGPVGWETGIATFVDSEETKIISPTTNQAQVTEAPVTKPKVFETKMTEMEIFEYLTTQKPISDQPLTSKPSTLTNIPSLMTYKTPQKSQKKPQKEQTQYTTSTRQTTVEEDRSEIEDTQESTTELTFHYKEVSDQPSSSEEFENQTPPSEEEITKEVTKEVTTKKPFKITTTSRTKAKRLEEIEKKKSNEKIAISNAILPPTVEHDQPLKVQLSNSGVPVVTTDDTENTTEPGIVLPEIKTLLQSPDINNFMKDTDSPILIQVLQPLSVIFGKNYIKKIVKDIDTNKYPTNVALLSAILKKAPTYPQVAKNSHLMSVINKYTFSIEYVGPTILLPIVVSSKKLVSNVVYSTFDSDDFTHGGISESPPDESLSDKVTVPLVNPKLLLQSINPTNPYADLLPTLERGNVYAKTIQPLKIILTTTKITQILGPDFDPLVYPNKIALLITLLYKLQKSKTIQSNLKLKSLIDNYIQAIELPSMNVEVSEDRLVKMMTETTGQWQPELTSLIAALRAPTNDNEEAMTKEIEQFLDDPTLLEKLNIAKPPLTMTRGELIQKIIVSALSGTIRFEKRLLKALRYYKDKVEFTEMGTLPIMWVWVETYTVKAEIQLGDMIQQTVNFDQLTYKEKLAYNDVITYLAQNPTLLQDNEDFDFEKYKTQGQFVKGLFKHLLKKSQVNNKIKRNIEMILPRVSQTGAGAITMPTFSSI